MYVFRFIAANTIRDLRAQGMAAAEGGRRRRLNGLVDEHAICVSCLHSLPVSTRYLSRMGRDLPLHSNAENGGQWHLVDIHTG